MCVVLDGRCEVERVRGFMCMEGTVCVCFGWRTGFFGYMYAKYI